MGHWSDRGHLPWIDGSHTACLGNHEFIYTLASLVSILRSTSVDMVRVTSILYHRLPAICGAAGNWGFSQFRIPLATRNCVDASSPGTLQRLFCDCAISSTEGLWSLVECSLHALGEPC